MPRTNPNVVEVRYVVQHKDGQLLGTNDRWVVSITHAKKYMTRGGAIRAIERLTFGQVAFSREVVYSMAASDWRFSGGGAK